MNASTATPASSDVYLAAWWNQNAGARVAVIVRDSQELIRACLTDRDAAIPEARRRATKRGLTITHDNTMRTLVIQTAEPVGQAVQP